MTRLLAVEFLPHSSPPDQFYSNIVRAYSLCDTLSRTDCPISLASENKGTLTPSSRRRSCRHHRHLLYSLPSPSSSSSSSSSSGSWRRSTAAATDRSGWSEAGHSGCILLMPNGTPRTPWANAATIGKTLPEWLGTPPPRLALRGVPFFGVE